MIFLSDRNIIKIYKYHWNRHGIISCRFCAIFGWIYISCGLSRNLHRLWCCQNIISLFLQMFEKFVRYILTKCGDDGIIRIHKWLNTNVCRRNTIVIRLYHYSNEWITSRFIVFVIQSLDMHVGVNSFHMFTQWNIILLSIWISHLPI